MSPAEAALWERLKRFAFDDPTSPRPFSVRLAQENGWSLRHAQRVLAEYRRFLFLAATGAAPACPSEAVDEAWHLHLCYTRSYWRDLCERVLGQPLHHEPSRGGDEQLDHHRAMYARTLDAYRVAFGEAPPESVWPAAAERFPGSAPERVDRTHYWVIAKPRWPWSQRGRRFGSVAACLALLPLAPAALNPLDLPGPVFAALYAVLLIITAIGLLAFRQVLRPRDDGAALPPLDAYDAAVLTGGEELALRIAVSELVADGVVGPETGDGWKLEVKKELPVGQHPLVQAVFAGVVQSNDPSLDDALNAGRPEAARLGARLEDEQLLETSASFAAVRRASGVLVGLVLLLGLAKMAVGLSRGRPVAILAGLCVAAVVMGYFAMRRPRRTPRGQRALTALREKHRGLNDKKQLFAEHADMAPMGMALFGLGALAVAGGELAQLSDWWRPKTQGGSGCTAGSGCGGSGCGGGGGCGGGCGGCGGGD